MVAPTASALRAAFDAPTAFTVGVEEELMLLDPESLDLANVAPAVLEAAGNDSRFKLELPASQLEIVTAPAPSAAEAARQLADGRRDLVARAGDLARFACTGLHPFAAAEGVLNVGERYARIEDAYGPIARRQLLCALQVHVAVRGADRALAVHNAIRSYLPEVAALAANAPFHEGRDTGLASWRPSVAELLPRHGVAPALRSWEAYAEALGWLDEPGQWWWEVRPHPAHGTLEIRTPDAQATVEEAEAIIAVVHALAAWLAERHDAGETLAMHADWRIRENAWSAARLGLDGTMSDLDTGARGPTRERVLALLDALETTAARLAGQAGLRHARAMAEHGNGAARQRAIAEDGGLEAVARDLADRFVPAPAG
jgi:carboxylate-amine ligase